MLVQLPCGCIMFSIASLNDSEAWLDIPPPDLYREDAAGTRYCVKCGWIIGANKNKSFQFLNGPAYTSIVSVEHGSGIGANSEAIMWAVSEADFRRLQKLNDERNLVDKLIHLVQESCKGIGIHPDLMETIEKIKAMRGK